MIILPCCSGAFLLYAGARAEPDQPGAAQPAGQVSPPPAAATTDHPELGPTDGIQYQICQSAPALQGVQGT